MPPLSRRRNRERGARERRRGVVMLIVLFFALLLTSSIATFSRRAIVDTIVARNREAAARAEAIARGGVRLAIALLLHDRIAGEASGVPLDTYQEPWYRIRDLELPAPEGATLRIEIEDSGSRFNLNSVFDFSQSAGGAYAETIPFLQEFFDKVINEMPIAPEERERYDVTDLAESLVDWVDADDARLAGGFEDDYYQQQEPPYRAANRPLLSVDDLLLVEGFDRALVDALRPYVTVHPYVGINGVNVNTAPPHVLALLFSSDGVEDRLANRDEVEQIVAIREAGGLLCGEGISHELCTPITSIMPNPIFPPPGFASADFTITAEAHVGEIERRIVAVVDRNVDPPLLLSWKVR